MTRNISAADDRDPRAFASSAIVTLFVVQIA